VLAYLFWHRPRDSDVAAYEQALHAFHRSLARTPPVGVCGSASYRVAELPWLASPAGADPARHADAVPAYEDWYLLEDFTALGVLNEAAVGRGHRTAHHEAARRLGCGAGGLYGLIEGDRSEIAQHGALLGEASLAVWVQRPLGAQERGLGELLGDGIDPGHASLWRRQLVFGPAPEFCLLVRDRAEIGQPTGVAPTRLPEGWTASIIDREVLWSG